MLVIGGEEVDTFEGDGGGERRGTLVMGQLLRQR